MLSKSRRLTASEVRAILLKGRSIWGLGVSAKYLPAPTTKAAIVVSKRTAKTATRRNVLRRAGYITLQKMPLPPVHAVFFITTTKFDPEALKTLCSQLS